MNSSKPQQQQTLSSNQVIPRGSQYQKYAFKEKKKLKIQSGGSSSIGARSTNEDTFLIIDDARKLLNSKKSKKKCRYYAVFDGHGGIQASQACLQLLHGEILGDADFELGYFESVVGNAFERVDGKLNETVGDGSGSTAVTVVLKDRWMIVGNVGDSECLVVNTKYGVEHEVVTVKHTAKDEAEKKRMKENGGYVFNGRVYGSLAVSRSLGDKSYKGKGVVIAQPYTVVHELTSKDTIIILACDGIFERMSYDDVVNFVVDLQKQGKSPQEVSTALVDEAIQKGSKDNSTAIIIYLKWA
ncbi:Protein phosphatase 2C-2 [Entamoeba marina]